MSPAYEYLRRVLAVTAGWLITAALLLAGVASAEGPSDPEKLRSACVEFVAAHTEQATIKGLAEWTDQKKRRTLQAIVDRIESRLDTAREGVIGNLPEHDIERLKAILGVREAVRIVREDGNWPQFGRIPKLLSEMRRKSEVLHEEALLQLCR